MNHIAPRPQPDLDDAYWDDVYGSQFNAWQFLQASVPKVRQKPDCTLLEQAASSRLPLLQGECEQPTILRSVGFALKGVES